MRIIALVLILTVTSCATQYAPKGMTGGYSETQLDENIYRVTFKGNGATDAERAQDFAFLRCAELALENGFSYFAVMDSNAYTDVNTTTTPAVSQTQYYQAGNNVQSQTYQYGGGTSVSEKPRAVLTITILKEEPEDLVSYDAEFIRQSIRGKYQLPL